MLHRYRRIALKSNVLLSFTGDRITSLLRRGGAFLGVFCALIILIALCDLAVRAVLRLELRWDTFWYHIPFAALRGGLNIPYEMLEAMKERYLGFPPLPHLLQGILWRLSGSINATGIINYMAFIFFLIFCHFKLKARFWLVALIALTSPTVLIHTTVSYVDLFANSLLAIGISACIYMYIFDQQQDRSLLIWGLTGLIGATWSKYQLVPIAAIFFLFFIFIYVCRAYKKVDNRFQSLLLVVIAILLAAAPYLKNLALYKNPFWPVKVPLTGELFPYKEDPQVEGLVQRPPPLKDLSQFELFFHSLFEIGHPKHYDHRPRWIIDQGNASIAFRSGGFWNVAVIIYLISSMAILILLNRKKGLYFVLLTASLICFLAILPQSHELRYYQFLPLCWAATIGMLYPYFQKQYTRTAFFALLLFTSLFLYMVEVNRIHYRIEKIGYLEAAEAWGAQKWWKRLQQNVPYCPIDMAPIGILLTGPTMSEFQIIDRSHENLCPPNSMILKKTMEISTKDSTIGQAEQLVKSRPTAENYLNLSHSYYNAQRFEDAIKASHNALSIKPDYDAAYNNICASYNSMKMWAKAIDACQSGLAINPSNQLIKNNLAWAKKNKDGK